MLEQASQGTVADVPSPEMCMAKLDGTLSNQVYFQSPMARGLELDGLQGPLPIQTSP